MYNLSINTDSFREPLFRMPHKDPDNHHRQHQTLRNPFLRDPFANNVFNRTNVPLPSCHQGPDTQARRNIIKLITVYIAFAHSRPSSTSYDKSAFLVKIHKIVLYG
jgi:hypothetical protein